MKMVKRVILYMIIIEGRYWYLGFEENKEVGLIIKILIRI